MGKLVLAVGAIMGALSACGDITVSDVEVFSGYPWKEVVVGYTITGTDANADIVRLMVMDKLANKSYAAKTLAGAELSEGRHIMRWNAAAEGVKLLSANVVFSVAVMNCGGVQLWENGPYWAECNVGATKPEEYGYYFWWGDTVGNKRVGSNWNAVADQKTGFSFSKENCPTYGKDDTMLKAQGYVDAAGNLVGKYDAATQHLGAPWRMPTDAEWGELESNCKVVWTTRDGVPGRLVSGKGDYASRSIFLPAAGVAIDDILDSAESRGTYWSSTANLDLDAWCFDFKSSFSRRCVWRRWEGLPVRPLRGFAQ